MSSALSPRVALHTTSSPASSSPTAPSSPTAVRASDSERETVVARLHDALGEGRLDLPENETRVAAAYAARYRHELPPLLADLPGRSPLAGSTAPTWAAIRTAIVWRLRVLLGAAGAMTSPPTSRQRLTTGVVVALVVVWLVVCAAAGALSA